MRFIHDAGALLLGCAAVSAAVSATPLAQPQQAVLPIPALPQQLMAPVRAPEVADSNLGKAADSERLEQARGGADTHINNFDARLNGTVSGNSAFNVATGSNAIDGGAFSNAAGIPIVIQNSGANVLIQNSTIVNLQLR